MFEVSEDGGRSGTFREDAFSQGVARRQSVSGAGGASYFTATRGQVAFYKKELPDTLILSISGQLQQLSAKKEMFEFQLQWLYLSGRYRDAPTEELSEEIDDLALRISRFVLRHESRVFVAAPLCRSWRRCCQ